MVLPNLLRLLSQVMKFQFHIKNSTEDYTVRMKHAETFDDAMEMDV